MLRGNGPVEFKLYTTNGQPTGRPTIKLRGCYEDVSSKLPGSYMEFSLYNTATVNLARPRWLQ